MKNQDQNTTSRILIQYGKPTISGDIFEKGCFGESIEKIQDIEIINHNLLIDHSVAIKEIGLKKSRPCNCWLNVGNCKCEE